MSLKVPWNHDSGLTRTSFHDRNLVQILEAIDEHIPKFQVFCKGIDEAFLEPVRKGTLDQNPIWRQNPKPTLLMHFLKKPPLKVMELPQDSASWMLGKLRADEAAGSGSSDSRADARALVRTVNPQMAMRAMLPNKTNPGSASSSQPGNHSANHDKRHREQRTSKLRKTRQKPQDSLPISTSSIVRGQTKSHPSSLDQTPFPSSLPLMESDQTSSPALFQSSENTVSVAQQTLSRRVATSNDSPEKLRQRLPASSPGVSNFAMPEFGAIATRRNQPLSGVIPLSKPIQLDSALSDARSIQDIHSKTPKRPSDVFASTSVQLSSKRAKSAGAMSGGVANASYVLDDKPRRLPSLECTEQRLDKDSLQYESTQRQPHTVSTDLESPAPEGVDSSLMALATDFGTPSSTTAASNP